MIIEFFQSIQNPFLDGLFHGITMLGDNFTFLLLFAIVYWCVDKKLGYLLGMTLLFTSSVNSAVKEYFKAPRPFETLDIHTIGKGTAGGYSFPSGHSQSSASFFTLLSLKTSRIMIGIGIFFTVLIAVSRVYMGVHWPKDVVYGITIGMTAAGLVFVVDKITNEMIAGCFVLCLSLAIFFSPLEINQDFSYSLWAMVGITAGSLFERLFVGFGPSRTIVAGIGRVLFGLIVSAASLVVIYYFFPHYPFLYITVSTFVASGLVPLAFEKEMKKYY